MRRWWLACGAVLVLGLGQSASRAAVVLVSQERGVGARAEIGGLVGAPALTETASGFGAFNEEATASILDPTDQDRADARVTQNSDLSTDGFSISGIYEFQNSGEVADGVSLARVVFDVTGSQAYSFSYDLQADARNLLGPRNAIATVDLRRVNPAGPSVVGPASVSSNHELDTGLPGSAVFDGSGVLSAGRYELFLKVGGLDFDEPGSGTTDSSDSTVSYSVNLSFTGGNGGGPNPIPLPPGVWAGGATLGAIAFGRVRRMLCRVVG